MLLVKIKSLKQFSTQCQNYFNNCFGVGTATCMLVLETAVYCSTNNIPDGCRLYFLGLIKVTNWLLATKIANTKS